MAVVLKAVSPSGWTNIYGPFPDNRAAHEFAENVLDATTKNIRADIFDLIPPELRAP